MDRRSAGRVDGERDRREAALGERAGDHALEPREAEAGAAEPEPADHAAQPEHAHHRRAIAETPERQTPERAPQGAGGIYG